MESYHQHLLTKAKDASAGYDPSKPVSHSEVRRAEARRLTSLMESHPTFSFLRLGDVELANLLAIQNGHAIRGAKFEREREISNAKVYGCPGLAPEHYERLLMSYRECDFLDLQDRYWFNAAYLPDLRLERSSELAVNTSPETSMIFYDWSEHELGTYLTRHHCLFAGAEAGVLAELWKDPRYRDCAAGTIPREANASFYQDARALATNLDLIADDLAAEIQRVGADTLFLSLGGGAKIICHELSRRCGVRCYDFGGQTRALSYSGSSGEAARRAVHNPYLFRVGFDVYMDALERALPDSAPLATLARAQAQVCLELQRKETGWSYAVDLFSADCFDPSLENMRHFETAYAAYLRRFGRFIKSNPEASRLHTEFENWRTEHGLGWKASLRSARRQLAGLKNRMLRRNTQS